MFKKKKNDDVTSALIGCPWHLAEQKKKNPFFASVMRDSRAHTKKNKSQRSIESISICSFPIIFFYRLAFLFVVLDTEKIIRERTDVVAVRDLGHCLQPYEKEKKKTMEK